MTTILCRISKVIGRHIADYPEGANELIYGLAEILCKDKRITEKFEKSIGRQERYYLMKKYELRRKINSGEV
jgi:hypothetical protein